MFDTITSHTADIGIKEKAKNLKILFKKCADKIIKLSLKNNINNNNLKKINLFLKNKNSSYEYLLHDFLNEIIYFIFVKKIHPFKIIIKNIDENGIMADFFYKKVLENEILRELKNVTYHNLKIKKSKNCYFAEFVIDI